MSNQDKDYGNILCQAIDTIVTERLSGLEYDQTVLCTIVDDTERDKGKYIVSNGSVKFDVVSEITTYRNNNNVYVLIPKGDWNETKTIIGKKDNKNQKESYVYRNPFDYLVNITQNIIKENISQGLVANNEDTQSIIIWSQDIEGEKFSGYTRLGLQAQFRSWLNPFYVTIDDEQGNKISESSRIISGSYGLRLKITVQGDKTADEILEEKDYYLYLDSSNMNGNPYEFSTYFQQEQVFDISNFEHITGLELQFYQEAGSFQDIDGNLINDKDFLGNLINPNLFVKDPYIAFGYDTRDFENDEIILYSLNNSTFTSSVEDDINQKKVELRWIHNFGNNNLRTVKAEDKENLKYEVKWYKYRLGAPSADKYSGVYWEYINADEDNEFSCTFIPNTSLSEESIKAIIFYNNRIVRSNIVKFTNEKEVINQATVDAISAVSINCEDNTYGNYHIYKLDNSLIDQKDSSELRNFKIHFSDSELTEAEKVEWIIPKKNSMIILNDDYITANGGYDEGDDNNYRIVRNIAIDENSGEYQVGEANIQQYRIRGYYSQNYGNNTITCIVTKDRIQYTGTKELTFGPAGTSGTDCTFILDFDNGITALTIGNPVATTVTARLYDYENKEVDLSEYSIEWSILNQNQITYNVIESPYQVELQLTSNNPNMTSNYNILQAKLTNFGDFELIAYLPLPIRRDTNYKYISGTTSLVYNSSGYLDNFYWNPYTLYYTQGADSDILESYNNWGISTQNSNYGPKLEDYTDKDKNITRYRLKPTSIYTDDGTNTGACIYCTLNSTVVWSQPILITQNRYPAAILNTWNGELSLGGEDGNTIMSARVIAGRKESNNSFSGVMMGDWKGKDATADITSNTGIYGFYQGSASFGFRDNGTAFIGKAGTGRIEFNGEKSIIQSAVYEDGQGMSINLLEGTINAHEFELNVGGIRKDDNTIFISTNSNNYPLQIGSRFYVDWDGTINATNGEFSGTITADSGKIGAWTISEAEDNKGALYAGDTYLYPTGKIKAGEDFSVSASGKLEAKGADISGKITATSGELGSLTVTGTLTSESGQLDFGDNFKVSSTGILSAKGANISGTITAEEGSIGGWTIGTSTLTGGSVTLDSANGIKAPSITVVNETADIGTLGSYSGSADGINSTTVIGINSSSNSVVLQSSNYVRLSANSGIKLDSGGEIVCSGTKFSMNQMSSLALPATVMSADGNTLFTVNGSTMDFSCTVTGIYATLK